MLIVEIEYFIYTIIALISLYLNTYVALPNRYYAALMHVFNLFMFYISKHAMKFFQLIQKMFSRKKKSTSLFSSALTEALSEMEKEMDLYKSK